MERPEIRSQNDHLLSRLKIGFIVLVGVSAGLIASYAEGSLTEVLTAIGAGVAVGILLVWLAFPSPTEDSASQTHGRR